METLTTMRDKQEFAENLLILRHQALFPNGVLLRGFSLLIEVLLDIRDILRRTR